MNYNIQLSHVYNDHEICRRPTSARSNFTRSASIARRLLPSGRKNFTNISMQNDLKTMHHRCNELNELAGSARNRWRFLFV